MEELLDQQHKLLMRGSQLHARIGARKVPKVKEPPRSFAAWDYVLEEMKWMAQDFIEERRHKSILALVLITEIRENQRYKLIEQQEVLRQAQTQARYISEAVQQCYLKLDDGEREDEDGDVVMTDEHGEGPKVASYMVKVIRRIGYTAASGEPIKEIEEPVVPLSADENALEQGSTCDDAPQVSVHNLLFYDIEDASKAEAEFKSLCETLNLEDVDVFAPPGPDREMMDLDLELSLKDQKSYELLPDAEESMLLKYSQPAEESFELPRLMRFQSEIHDFSNTPRLSRRWQIFQDMYLEEFVCEHGGHWDLVADLLNVHPVTRGNCFGMKDVRERWMALQRQKGRSVEAGYTPQQVLQGNGQLVTHIVGRYSWFPLRLNSDKHSKILSEMNTLEPKPCDKPFDFLVKNCSFETNSYFFNYLDINAKYYPEETIPKYSFTSKQSDFSLRGVMKVTEMAGIVRPTGSCKDPSELTKPTVVPVRAQVQAPVMSAVRAAPRPAPRSTPTPTSHLGVYSNSMAPSPTNFANTTRTTQKRKTEEDPANK